MTDYKTVIQLAQEKGYKLYLPDIFFDQYTIAGSRDEGYGDDNIEREVKQVEQFLELILIQKWLRYDRQMSVVVEDRCVTQDWAAIVRRLYSMDNLFIELYNSDETALLEGIYEALKLLP